MHLLENLRSSHQPWIFRWSGWLWTRAAPIRIIEPRCQRRRAGAVKCYRGPGHAPAASLSFRKVQRHPASLDKILELVGSPGPASCSHTFREHQRRSGFADNGRFQAKTALGQMYCGSWSTLRFRRQGSNLWPSLRSGASVPQHPAERQSGL